MQQVEKSTATILQIMTKTVNITLEEFNQLLEGVKNWLQHLGSEFEVLFVKNVNPIMDDFKALIESITPIVDNFKNTLISSVKDLNKSISDVVAEFATTRKELVNNSTELREIIDYLNDKSKKYHVLEYLANVLEGLDKAINKVANFFGKVEHAFEKITIALDSVEKFFTGIEKFFDSILKSIDLVLSIPEKIQNIIVRFIDVIDQIKNLISSVWNIFNNVFQAIFGLSFDEVLASFFDQFKNIFSSVSEGIKNTFTGVWSSIEEFAGGVWDFFAGNKEGAPLINNDIAFPNLLTSPPLISSVLFDEGGGVSQTLNQQTYINVTTAGAGQDIANQIAGKQEQVNSDFLRNLKGVIL